MLFFERPCIMMKFVNPKQHSPLRLCADNKFRTTKIQFSYVEQTKHQILSNSQGSNRNDCATKIINRGQKGQSEYNYVCMRCVHCESKATLNSFLTELRSSINQKHCRSLILFIHGAQLSVNHNKNYIV